jgi:diguanylate cyclase (GGDEF)-like protein/PAS domain S-box-containing protein
MMRRIQRLLSPLRRRNIRDAVAMAIICGASYFVAQRFEIFDRVFSYVEQHKNYAFDEFIVVTFVFGFLMVIYTLRRASDFKQEVRKREEVERLIGEQSVQLAVAVNNLPQGILMFNSAERLVVCNDAYLKMYNFTRDVVKPGTTLLAIFQHRIDVGLLKGSAQEYRTKLMGKLALNKVFNWVIDTSDGRDITITNYPMASGGWIAVHDDRTESRRREASFRLLFDNNPVVMGVIDRETLRFLAVNEAAIAQYGYSREQFLAMKVTDVRIEDVESSAAFVRAFPDSHGEKYVGLHRRADGTTMHVTAVSRALRYENRLARLVAITDVTARIESERELIRAKMFLNAVIDSVPLPIVVKNAGDRRFTLVNKASEELHGYRREDVIGKTLYDIYPKDRSDIVTAQDAESCLSFQPIIIPDHIIATPKGDRLITSKKVAIRDDDGKPEYLLTLIDDVTERRHAENELRRTKLFLNAVIENLPLPIVVKTVEGDRFTIINKASEELHGYRRDMIIGKTPHDIFPKVRADNIVAKDLECVLSDRPVLTPEHMIETPKGARLITSTKVAIPGDDGKPEYVLSVVEDVTERRHAENELRQTKVFLDTVIENLPLPIVVKAVKDSRYLRINKANEELFGYPRDELIGKTPYDIFPKIRADNIAAKDRECALSDRPIQTAEHAVETHKGTRLITSKKVAIPGDDGKPEYVLSVVEDVTERRRSEKLIEHMAHSDALTDLPNRTAFNERLSKVLTSAEAESRSFAILCMDLDGFKEVNDIYGHAVGDTLLCQVADRLRAAGGDTFIARLGGDEFTIIAERAAPSSVSELTDRLLAAFVDDFDIDGHQVTQALSIGVAIYPEHGKDDKTLLKNADAALYHAKSENPGTAYYFEAKMDARLRERGALQTDLTFAIEHNELALHYQPQLKMNGEVTGFEALARWYSPKRGMVPPALFIPLAEESSLILVMGEWVLREACREAASWDKPLKIAINVSPVQFRHGDLPRLVHSVLLETGLAASRLELEITEGVLIDDFNRAVGILRRLKALGVQIVMDDFGTGYSSLSYLRAFPFDKLKIDRSFIADLENNQQSVAIVKAVIGLSRSLKIPIVAEGVETQAQHDFLTHEGCDEVQGYLTGRPRVIADYADVVGRKMIAPARARAV